MGVVYIASRGSETIALKIIRDSIIDDPSQATRFLREIETLKSIDSTYVAKVLDTGTHQERPWFTTEFVNGPDLKSHVADKGPLTGSAWDSLAKGLLGGIAAIHAAGVIHRDIKPANIILSESGPKIIDFGIAQVADATSVTSTGAIAGSPAWFSPEQIGGSEISTATDLFSAGSTLVYAATGKSPWGDVEATTKASVYKILLDEPDLSGLSEKQSRLVRPLLDKNPSERSRVGKPNTDNQQEVTISSAESWFQRLGLLSRSTKLAWSLAIILFATSGGLVLNSFATPNAGDSLGDPAEQAESKEDIAEPLPAVPLGPDFFDEIVSGLELTSAQYGDRITFTLAGPGAAYVRVAEVSLEEIPDEWTGECESPLTLTRAPAGAALWAVSCELSLPASGETVPATAKGSMTFIDNDGRKYLHPLGIELEIEALPVAPVNPPPQLGLEVLPVDYGNTVSAAALRNKEVFVSGNTLVYCHWVPEALVRERIQKGEFTQALALSPSGTVVVGRGVIRLGSVDSLYQAGQDCPGYSGNGPSERLEISWSIMAPHARADGSVNLRIIRPGGAGGPLEYVIFVR
jgi:hypothetical protein